MKIRAFEVREDERATFALLSQSKEVELFLSEERLSLETIDLTFGCEGITILGGTKVKKEILEELKKRGVKYLTTRTIGYNHIDIVSAKEMGMRVSNAAYAPNCIADFTIMLMIMSLRKYKQAMFRGNVNDYSLSGLQGREMRNMTIGVIGTGKIGSTVVKSLSGFGGRILVYDPHPNLNLDGYAQYVNLETLYQSCDIISLHTPLFQETYHLIDQDAIDLMKQGVILINTARGELIEVDALVSGIESEKIGAVGLDVIEEEEGIYHKDLRTDIIKNRNMAYLRQFPNVTMTQHMAFYTEEAVKSMVECGVNNLLLMKNGHCDLEL